MLKCKKVIRLTTSLFLFIFMLFSVLDKICSSLCLVTFKFPIYVNIHREDARDGSSGYCRELPATSLLYYTCLVVARCGCWRCRISCKYRE